MADEYDLQQSLQDQTDSFLAQNRTFAWVADSNNGSYADCHRREWYSKFWTIFVVQQFIYPSTSRNDLKRCSWKFK